MPETIEAPHPDELLELAGLIGELAKKVDDIAGQSQPLEATKRAQESALTALTAALDGIKALNFHVLDNNLGKVSTRLSEVEKQANTALEALQKQIADVSDRLALTKGESEKRFELERNDRVGLAQKRETDAQEFAVAVDGVRGEVVALQKTLLDRIESARKEFAEPKGFNLRGKYDGQSTYSRFDVAEMNGSSYASNEDNNTEQPSPKSKKWQLMARRGAAANGAASPSQDELANLVTLTDGATIAWNLLNPVARVTIAGARTLTVSNLRAGGTYILHVIQDGTGSRTMTWPASVAWPGGTAPTLTTTASYRDIFTFTSNGTTLFGSYVQNYAL